MTAEWPPQRAALGQGSRPCPNGTTADEQPADLARAGAAPPARGCQYRRLVELAQEGIWAIDAGAVTTYVNPRLADMLGYTVAEMLGRPLFAFMDEAWAERCRHYIARRRRGIAEQLEFEFVRKDGSRLVAGLSTGPILEGGQYAGAVALVVDLTERKRQEAVHATQAQLEGALLLARTVAHLLNNALTPVVGFAELLGMQPVLQRDPVLASYVRAIQDGAQRAAAQIHALQQIVRLEAAPPELWAGPNQPVLDLERSTAPAVPPHEGQPWGSRGGTGTDPGRRG